MPEWTIQPERSGSRLDIFLAGEMDVSRGEAQRILEAQAAEVNGRPAKANYKLREGDRVHAEHLEAKPATVLAEEIPLQVVFEDSDILVINKPRGIVVNPAPGNESGTLVNAVLAHADDLSGIGGELRPGIVHRLDKDTSGLLVIAKNDAAHHSLQAQIQAKTAERVYQALVWGKPRFERAEVDAPIGRHPSDRKKMAVLTDSRHTSREAVTELTVRERLGPFCLLEAKLQTGRTHQIRVHCAYIGHPVVGDPLYGGIRKVPAENVRSSQKAAIESAIANLHGQALHAFRLSFIHPRTAQILPFQAPPPPGRPARRGLRPADFITPA
jgi:23S rRNA pseudouridine1911/1915/1917 synthase